MIDDICGTRLDPSLYAAILFQHIDDKYKDVFMDVIANELVCQMAAVAA